MSYPGPRVVVMATPTFELHTSAATSDEAIERFYLEPGPPDGGRFFWASMAGLPDIAEIS
jgi:hypothetical protein